MSEHSLIGDYLRMARTVREQYGEKCILLMQCGAFYEIYDICDEPSVQLSVCRDVLFLRVGKRSNKFTAADGNVHDVFFAGFKVDNIDRYRSLLMRRGYSFAIVKQDPERPSLRHLSHVVSPGCNEHAESPAVVVAVCRVDTCVVCRYDFSLNVLELFERTTKSNHAANVVRQAVSEHGNCSEIIVYDAPDDEAQAKWRACFANVALRFSVAPPCSFAEDWQTHALASHYRRHVSVGASIKHKLGVASASSVQVAALVLMLRFLRSHDEELAQNFPHPKLDTASPSGVAILENTFSFLNTFDDDAPMTVMRVVGKYVHTDMGRRLLRQRLRQPTREASELKSRYDGVDSMYAASCRGALDALLRRIRDIAKIASKLQRKRVTVDELRTAHTILEHASALVDAVHADDALTVHLLPETEYSLHAAIEALSTKGEALWNCPHTENAHSVAGLDRPMQDYKQAMRAVVEWQHSARKKIGCETQPSVAELVGNARSGYNIQCTSAKASILRARDPHEYAYAGSGQKVRFTSTTIVDLMENLAKTESLLQDRVAGCVQTVVDEVNEGFFKPHVEDLIAFVAEVDLLHGVARLARERNYVRPVLLDATQHGSMHAKGLRHPVMEVVVDEAGKSYVTNDVEIAPDKSMKIYGVNSAGKSVLLKSIALAGIMAQAGLFVPCTTFEIAPYRNYMLHIGGRDDMYSGQSTMVREMEMLSSVLRASRDGGGAHTLFLADELGNSTEDASAVAIVSSLLHTLHGRRATMVLATHMFALQTNPFAQACHGVRNMHLEVRLEGENMIFERKLREGLPGIPNYGCMLAAKILQDDAAFIQTLLSERHRLAPHEDDASGRLKRSRYNSNAKGSECAICGHVPTAREIPLEFHHIQPQARARDGKLPDGTLVHSASNQALLCSACHDAVHRGDLTIDGYRDTLHGNELVVRRPS